MRKIRFLTFLLFNTSFLLSFGQFGNEWINANQTYWKIKVVKDDFYRITAAELQAVGFPLSTASNKIQLFRRGEEITINVQDNGSSIDYIEFYGKKNDGVGDARLYDNRSDQPHQFVNLFSDTSAYFLTYLTGTATSSKRIQPSSESPAGLIPEPFHYNDSLIVFSSNYYGGRQFGDRQSLSNYDEGEGLAGSDLANGESQNITFSFEDVVAGEESLLNVVLLGDNGNEQNVRFFLGPNNEGLVEIGNVVFQNRSSISFSQTFSNSLISEDGNLVLQVRTGSGSRVAVAYARVQVSQEIKDFPNDNKHITFLNTGSRKYVPVKTSNPQEIRIFDITDEVNVKRLSKGVFSDRVEVVLGMSSTKMLAVRQPRLVASLAPIAFPSISLTGVNYLIVSHPTLRKDDLGNDPVLEFEKYRASPEGGSYEVQTLNVDQVYDLYNFGDPSPLGIVDFIGDAYDKGPLEFVLLIGKGFTPDKFRAKDRNNELNVPTYGLPGGDMMYTRNLGSGFQSPGIPIGRLNVRNTLELTAYLNKLKEMEAIPFDQLFRKNFLQLSGGRTARELDRFPEIIREFEDKIVKDFIGGTATNIDKASSESVKLIPIADEVNEGVGYITMFGHSSGEVADIDVGLVSDPQFGYDNKGKYPIFLVNGCKAGEIFDNNSTFGDDWMYTPGLGAIAFIAHTNFATEFELERWSDLWHDVGFGNDEFIDKSIGEVMVEVSQQYFTNYGQAESSLAQVHQTQLQGDPAFRIFGAGAPDYQIEPSGISAFGLESDLVLATEDSFKVDVIVKNFGRTVLDSLEMSINRFLPDGTSKNFVRGFQRVLRQDTLSFYLANEPFDQNEGLNIISITLDPFNKVEEINETNNTAQIELSIFEGGTINLFPINSGIVNTTSPDLIFQSSNSLDNARAYQLEVDVDPGFSSATKQVFTVSGEVFALQTLDLTTFDLEDTVSFFWRTRLAEPGQNESDEWVVSTFTYLSNGNEGWGQFDESQLNRNEISGVNFNASTSAWEFDQVATPVEVFTYGIDNEFFSSDDLRATVNNVNLLVSNPAFDSECNARTINAIVFDNESGSPYLPVLNGEQIDVLNSDVCGRRPQVIYQFRDNRTLETGTTLETLINRMDNGDKIIFFTIDSVAYSGWNDSFIAGMVSLGVDEATINTFVDGQPAIILGEKGAEPGTAVIVEDGSGLPAKEQSLLLQDNILTSFFTGKIKTQRFGPAQSWQNFSYSISGNENDTYSLELLGVNQNGDTTREVSGLPSALVNISTIDPVVFPTLDLVYLFTDEQDLTPPEINYWQVNFTPAPDGLLIPTNKETLKIQEGQEISKEFKFINFSATDFVDSAVVSATLLNATNGNSEEMIFKVPGPAAGDTTTFEVAFPSTNQVGESSLIVNVSANENEYYTTNNRVTLSRIVTVESDEINPVLDVTFDGYHILNGDIVSPNPLISIILRDENQYLFKDDTTGLSIKLKHPGDSTVFRDIQFTDPKVQFRPASEQNDLEIEYSPGPLEDGVYTLRVNGQDASGNAPGAPSGENSLSTPYEIQFEVINESTITHFYPYPNPFSTSCRFVFTLTGSEVPDQLKIQIMTVSGRVVREITQSEIGPLRVGNNITEYAWDGRDEFGDQLANGVYFYKVFVKSNGSDLSRRNTSGDRAFKNGFGKLYILR